jgi:hypothetical protein
MSTQLRSAVLKKASLSELLNINAAANDVKEKWQFLDGFVAVSSLLEFGLEK